MKIVVVEPHPDDAFLSLGWHLEHIWAEHDRTIITVYADRKRADEARAYAAAIGASSHVLGLDESKMLSEPGPIRAVPEVREALETWDVLLFPLGLQHPDHRRVAASRPAGNCWRYVDTPYQRKQKLADALRERTEDMILKSLAFPPKKKFRHVPLFKSQAKFFHYNSVDVLRYLPEIVLCPPSDGS